MEQLMWFDLTFNFKMVQVVVLGDIFILNF